MIAIQDAVHALPPRHFSTLKFLCQHLSRIAEASHVNRMSARNLSIVFGPTLLRPPSNTSPDIALARALADMPQQCQIVEHLIEQWEWVFGPIEFESEDEGE